MAQTKFFSASIVHLHEILAFILGEAKRVGFSSTELKHIELASEEAVVNIIEHAYQGKAGKIKVEVRSESGKQIAISICDEGEPFNPLQEAEPVDLVSPLEGRKVGGLGIFFLRQCLDEIVYRRDGSWNILTLIKKPQSLK